MFFPIDCDLAGESPSKTGRRSYFVGNRKVPADGSTNLILPYEPGEYLGKYIRKSSGTLAFKIVSSGEVVDLTCKGSYLPPDVVVVGFFDEEPEDGFQI